MLLPDATSHPHEEVTRQHSFGSFLLKGRVRRGGMAQCPPNYAPAHLQLQSLQTSVNEKLSNIHCWVNINKLSMNYNKTEYTVVTSVSSKLRNLRKMRNFGQYFLIFAHCYNDSKANWFKGLKFFCVKWNHFTIETLILNKNYSTP